MNVRHLKICDFLKGVVFSIYLAPTYINIFTIYAISNIHDVTWGSRPTTQTQKSNEVEKHKKSKYKNYRAKFLIVWIMANVAVGSALVYMARNEQYSIMFGISAFLMAIMIMKIVFASLYWLKAKNDRRRAYKTLRKRSSKVFSNINQNDSRENVFETFGNASDSGMIIRSHFDNEANGVFRTSVESKDILMGFDLRKEHDKQIEVLERFSRGSDRARLSKQIFGKINSNNEEFKEKKIEENKSTNYLSIKESDSHDEQDQSKYDDAIEVSKTKDKNASITEEHTTKTKQLSNDLESVENDDIRIEMETPGPDQISNQNSSYSDKPKHTKKILSPFSQIDRNAGDSSFEVSSDD